MYLKQSKYVLTLNSSLIILITIMETKYQNLINYIQEQITDGQLGPGEKVPSENQLEERWRRKDWYRGSVAAALMLALTAGKISRSGTVLR